MLDKFKYKSSLGDRIRKCREDARMTRPDAIEKLGISKSKLQAWENGVNEPSASELIVISEVFGVSANWLLTGEQAGKEKSPSFQLFEVNFNERDYIFIPRYDISAAAGDGSWLDTEEPIFSLALRKEWIEQQFSKKPATLSAVTVKGDSMTGVLNDGDVIIVNHADTDPREGVYVLRIDGYLYVKHLQRLPGDIVEVSSTSPLYKPFRVDLKHAADFAVIGKVILYARRL